MDKIGFIQGRLSPIVDGKIQAFPRNYWEGEFSQAREIGISKIEWTLDQEDLLLNPFLTPEGQDRIKSLMDQFDIEVPSLTGDCFMQKPFYKTDGSEKEFLLKCLDKIIESCGAIGTRYVIFPLVDNGTLENKDQEKILLKELGARVGLLEKHNVKILFESDYPPQRLARFISVFPLGHFGINYDSGNSASLDFDVSDEFRAYSSRILNVHIKDRLTGGGTVPLGTGSTDFEQLFKNLIKYNYTGNLILQTARASDGSHRETLQKYREFVLELMRKYGM